MRRRVRQRIILALLLMILLVAPLQLPLVSSRSRTGCTEQGCHAGTGYAQYLSVIPQLSGPQGPLRLQVGEPATISALVRNDVNAPNHRTLARVTVTLTALEGVVEVLGDRTVTLSAVTPGDHSVQWQVRPLREAPERLQFTAAGLNDHQKVATVDTVIVPLSFALGLSLTRIESVTGRNAQLELQLSTRQELAQVAIDPSFEVADLLSVSPARFERLQGNTTTTVHLQLHAAHGGTGELRIHWQGQGGQQVVSIPVVVHPAPEPVSTRSGDLWLAGRLAAAAALALLTLSLLSGGLIPSVRAAIVARVGGTRRQVALHTGCSALLLLVVLYHGLVLWLGPYRALSWDWHNVQSMALGAVLLTTALVGIARTPLRAALGEPRWRWLHWMLAYAVLMLLLAHVLLLSSTVRLVLPLPTTPWPI